MSAGNRIPCQWIEVGSLSRLVTAIVTVSPSRQRSSGPGTEPLTAVATAGRPVKLTGDLLDHEIETAARKHRGFDAAAGLCQGRPAPQVEPSDRAAGDQPLDEAAATNTDGPVRERGALVHRQPSSGGA